MVKSSAIFKTISLILVLAMLNFCSGCAKKNNAEDLSSRLHGTWKGTDNTNDSGEFSFYNDGTFEFNALGFSAAGTYITQVKDNKIVLNKKMYRSLANPVNINYNKGTIVAKIEFDGNNKIIMSDFSGDFADFSKDDVFTVIKQDKMDQKTFDISNASSNTSSSKSSNLSSNTSSGVFSSETSNSSSDKEKAVYNMGDSVNIDGIKITVVGAQQSDGQTVIIRIKATNTTGSSNSFTVSGIDLEVNGSMTNLDIWQTNTAGTPFLNDSDTLAVPFETDGNQTKISAIYFAVKSKVDFSNSFLLIPKTSDDPFAMGNTYVKIKLDHK